MCTARTPLSTVIVHPLQFIFGPSLTRPRNVCMIRPMKLSAYLEAKSITDADFAAIVGCDRSTVSRWRNEKTLPAPDQIVAIQRATNGRVKVNDWFERFAAE